MNLMSRIARFGVGGPLRAGPYAVINLFLHQISVSSVSYGCTFYTFSPSYTGSVSSFLHSHTFQAFSWSKICKIHRCGAVESRQFQFTALWLPSSMRVFFFSPIRTEEETCCFPNACLYRRSALPDVPLHIQLLYRSVLVNTEGQGVGLIGRLPLIQSLGTRLEAEAFFSCFCTSTTPTHQPQAHPGQALDVLRSIQPLLTHGTSLICFLTSHT